MADFETVTVRRDGAAATIVLDRPEALNAWNRQLGSDLLGALREAAGDDDVRAVRLTGAGRAFSSGADLRDITAMEDERTAEGDPDVQRLLRERYHPIITLVREMPKPVLAAVNGPAAGIGASLALASDLVIAAESAYLLLAFVNIGLVPDGGSSLLVPSRVGFARAAEMAMLGERIPAPKALDWGPRQKLRRRRVLALAAAAALPLLLAFAGTAFGSAIAPETGGSPNADKIHTLYWLVMIVAIVVFVGVEGALFYSLFKFRARRGAVAAQIRGNTRLEIGWTVGAAVILVVLAVVTFIELPGIRNPPNSGPNGLQLADRVLVAAGPSKALPPNGKSLNICVNGQQYVWRYTYASNCNNAPLNSVFSYEQMVVPTDTTVTLDINSQDVAHSWWIPKLGGKFDAIPGYTNHTWFKVPGKLAGTTFTGQCAELCGRNHANMIAEVTAMTPDNFEAWLDRQRAAIRRADQAAARQRQRVDKGQQPGG